MKGRGDSTSRVSESPMETQPGGAVLTTLPSTNQPIPFGKTMDPDKFNPENDWNKEQRTHDETDEELLDEESKEILSDISELEL